MTENAVLAIATLLLGLVVAVVGFLIVQAVNAGRTEIAALSADVKDELKALVSKDRELELAMMELKTKLLTLEAEMKRWWRRNGDDDEDAGK